MMVNDPNVVAEVRAAFAAYETALLTNDLASLNSCFWQDDNTIRYGAAEILYGISEIQAYRQNRSPIGLARTLARTVITTFGFDTATASTLFEREEQVGLIGRQQQTWIRFPAAGWKIVAAHVSLIPKPA
jgi:Protein of unknown function (DUF3225)